MLNCAPLLALTGDDVISKLVLNVAKSNQDPAGVSGEFWASCSVTPVRARARARAKARSAQRLPASPTPHIPVCPTRARSAGGWP